MAATAARPAEGPRKATLGGELAWASGSFATGALFNGMALFALFFMTTFLGIEPAVAGTIILVTRIYDGIIDPVIGAVSDRTNHRWGPRRIYLLIGAIGLGASFALFFNQPVLDSTSAAIATTLILMLYSTAYSVFTIPYLAMPPEIAPSYDGRTRLMSYRVFFLMAGVLGGSVGAPFLVSATGGDLTGYQAMGAILGGLAFVLCLFVFFAAAWLPRTERPASPKAESMAKLIASPFVDCAKVFGNAPFRLLTLVKLCQLGVLSTVLACSPYFFTYVLEMGQAQVGQYFAFFGISGILSIPAFRWVIKKFGKRESYITLIILYGLGLASWYLWTPGEAAYLSTVRAIFIGTCSTGTLLCALAMLPDTMEYDRLQSGESREGVMSGVFTFVENVAGALGPFLVGLLLQANGLIQSQDPNVEQPAAVLEAVQWGFSLIPALLCLIAIPFLVRYRLNAKQLQDMRGES